MSPTIYVASRESNNWDLSLEYEDRETAIALAPGEIGLQIGEVFYVGRKTPPILPSIDASEILMELQDRVFERAGETMGNWLDNVTPSQLEKLEYSLDLAFQAWMREHSHLPRWFCVAEIEQYVCPSSPRFLT